MESKERAISTIQWPKFWITEPVSIIKGLLLFLLLILGGLLCNNKQEGGQCALYLPAGWMVG